MNTLLRKPLSIQERLKQIGLLGYWELNRGTGVAEPNAFPKETLFDMAVTGTVSTAAGPSNNIPLAKSSGGGANFLSTPDSVYIPSGICQFSVCGWVFMTSKASTRPMIAHNQATGNQRSWVVRYNSATDRFDCECSLDGGTTNVSNATDASLGSPSTNTWYFLTGGFDGSRAWIKVNDLPRTYAAASIASLFDSTETMRILHDGTTGFVGRIAQVGLWNRLLLPSEIFWLYNSGQGRSLVRGA